MKKQSITLTLFCALILLSCLLKGQVPGHQRGLYVDKFIVLDNGSNISSIFSIVGNSTKEDELLNYCDKNHITYINLSDLYKVFQGSSAQVTTKKAALSAFICKAKSSQHCIQFVGAGVGGFGTIDDINSYNELQTPAFQFQDAERNSPYYSDLSFVEQIIGIPNLA